MDTPHPKERYSSRKDYNDNNKKKESLKMKIVNVAMAFAMAIMIAGCGQIDSDQAGFKTSFGKPDYEVLGPGLYGINPIGGALVRYTIRDMRSNVKTSAYTKDMQQAEFEVAVIYAPIRSKLIELHTKYGKDYSSVILIPAVQSALKDVIGTWEADQLVNGRDKATAAIFEKVQGLTTNTPITVKSIAILNIDYSDTFERAIEEKVVAAQDAIKAKNRTLQVEEESRQTIVRAKAEAEAISIRAKALNENKDVVLLNLIEKWDGKAPNTIAIGSDSKLMLPAAK